MEYKVFEENAARFVAQVFESPNRAGYPYHNLVHTRKVVEHAKEIALFYSCSEQDMCMISVAAWFHDIGQLYGEMEGHEEKSVVIMSNYLKSNDAPVDLITQVADCIMATRYGSDPQALHEKIICDADTYHFGTAFFRETEFLVKKEMEIRTGQSFPQWHKKSLALLKNHVFYTEYCQLLLRTGKQENIEWLESLQEL
jgi:HD superfamily phosphodiesterase